MVHWRGKEAEEDQEPNGVDDITEWTGMQYEDLVRLAQDQEQWRAMTANLLQEDGT